MFGKRFAVIAVGILIAGASYNLAESQSDASAPVTLYSTAQAERGKILYAKQCALCHRADLSGVGTWPALTGDEFVSKYADQPIFVLFHKIQATMPATTPGSLSGADTAAVLAYILSENSYPAGGTDLPGDGESLNKIPLVKPDKK